MFVLTDDAIDAAIDSISGYIVFTISTLTERPLEEVAEAFLASDTYALLSDKDTGYYWDSISELIDKFYDEIA